MRASRRAILQPAEPFLDLSGEDIRRRMFLTTDPAGRELCLRPDLTIPVSRDYLASPQAGEAAGFCYLGPVFRHRGDGAGRIPAGRHRIVRPHATPPRPTPRCSRSGSKRPRITASTAPEIRMGDVGLFSALIAALDLAPAWKRRLIKDFNRKASLAHDLDRLALAAIERPPEYQGVLAALAGSDPKAAHALVTDLLSIAGITAVGGRSVGEIADRFLEQAALGASAGLPRATRALIERFLAIAGDPDEAAAELRALAARRRARLSPPRSTCSRAAPASSPRAASTSRASASRPRSAAASTTTPASCSSCTIRRASTGQLVAGGRYDGLLTRLGARRADPGGRLRGLDRAARGTAEARA